MEGYPPNPLVPTGYINSNIPLFFPQPQITHVLTTPAQVYVSPDGSDDPANVGSITSPFASISAALFYVTNTLDQPLTTAVCIFVAPGTYEGGFSVPDQVYIIGPTNSPIPVIISGNVFAVPVASDATIGLQNLTLQGVSVGGAVYDANLEMINCRIQTDTVFSALSIAQDDPEINASVYAKECVFVATSEANGAVISGNMSEKTTVILENCELVTVAEEGVVIDMTGNLTVRNSSLLNTASPGNTLYPLIILQSGATLVPVVSLEGSIFRYSDVATTDIGGNKLAIRFNAPTQPITASMTNCTLSIYLGDSQTDIVKNIGAQNVTFTQSANSCLRDGKTIDATNMVLTAAHFLDDSPGPPGPGAGVESLNTLTGDITITGENGISIGAGEGNSLVISGSGVTSLAGLTGAVTLSSPDASININVAGSDIELEAVIPPIPVLSVGGKDGTVTFSAGDGISIGYGENNAAPITITNLGVQQLAGVNGVITLSGTNVAITVADQDIELGVTFPVDTVGGKTGTVALEAGDGIAISYGINNAAPINIANSGVLSVVAGTGITLSGDTPQNPTVNVNLPVYQATYYKSAPQTLTNGSTDITFDSTATWNNDAGYITHTSGLASFTVVQAGLYQLEWNASVLANGATWNTGNSKVISIDITRSPTAEQIVIGQTAVTATTQDYTQSLCSTFYLVAGDVINCRIQGNFATNTPTAAGLLNTFDLGTWFSWRFISLGGAVAYQNPPPVIQAAGTTALVPTNANTTYILTSGATQNFTTAGLGAGNAGLVWFVKNASAADIDIQAGGVAIAGITAVLHQKRNDTNTPAQYLYWSGTTLTMY